MTYVTKQNKNGETLVVWFMVVANEPVGGFRMPFCKTFSEDEALIAAMEIEASWGPGGNVKIEEVLLSRKRWELKFKSQWPLDNQS